MQVLMRAGGRLLGLLTVLLAVPLGSRADTITVFPSADTTIYQNMTSNSDGAGQALVVGDNDRGQASPRRALLEFDIAGSLPAGAMITSVQLSLVVSQASPSDSQARRIELHRLVDSWGEGTTGQGTGPTRSGQGFPAPVNGTSATWTHRFFSTTPWTTPGGDFLAMPSGSTLVGTAHQAYMWDSTATMVSDVQSWLDDPADNFGWLLLGDESGVSTARRFDSREATSASVRPTLQITFSAGPVPEPSTILLAAFGSLGCFAWLRRRGGPAGH